MEEEIDYESKEIKKWAIYSGLGGGYGGPSFDIFETCTAKEANDIAYNAACDCYDSYAGSGGLREISTIMEEDEEDEENAAEIYNEEREGWIVYCIEEYNAIKHAQYEE